MAGMFVKNTEHVKLLRKMRTGVGIKLHLQSGTEISQESA